PSPEFYHGTRELVKRNRRQVSGPTTARERKSLELNSAWSCSYPKFWSQDLRTKELLNKSARNFSRDNQMPYLQRNDRLTQKNAECHICCAVSEYSFESKLHI